MRAPLFLLGLLVIGSVHAAEVKLHRWSGALNVPDPVACSVDEQGRVYVAATARRKAADLDIREHPLWIPDDVALTSVEEKRELLKRELAPGKLRAARGGLKDHNHDGSIDWRDLTVHSERIYQLRDTDGDGTADKMTVFAEGFHSEVTGTAAGVLYHDGWVYAAIAPDLWRLKDTDDDGVADVREIVVHGFGVHIAYAGHDMHGLRLGPDGRIYWSIGDKGLNVTGKEGKKWFYPHEGAVMRVEPDGTGFEVFAHGLRNVQEIAFDEFGNLFGVDNDGDLPGEKERFVYITEQSDSGWRCGHQYMKSESRWMREGMWQPQTGTGEDASGQPLFITPPLANYANGPAGFVREPGTAMGESLRGHFILNQFPSGRMDAFAIKADGAAFQMINVRTINSGIMGVGGSWGPDGALYLADWMGGYPLDEKGAIWRADAAGDAVSDERRDTQAILAAGFGNRAIQELQTLLRHADQRVRLAAQLELAKRGSWDALMAVARDTTAPLLARVHGLWGGGIGFRRGKMEEAALHELLVAEQDPEMQVQIAKVVSEGKVTRQIVRPLIGLLKSQSPRVRFHVAIALGRIGAAEAGLYLLDLAEKDAADPWLRHALVTGLAGCMTPEILAERAESKSMQERLLCALALARLRSPLIAAYLGDAEADIVDEVARAIHDDQGIPDALPKLAKLIEGERPLPEHTFRRAINANVRLGELVNASRLLQFALRHPTPEGLTVLQTLVTFTDPHRLDLVDGMARAQAARDATGIAVNVVQPWLKDLRALSNPDMKTAVIELMVKLALKLDAPALHQIVVDSESKPALRVGALKLMGSQHPNDSAFGRALTVAAQKTAPVELRMESLVQTLAHQKDRAIGEVARVLEQGTLAEKQAALKLLASAEGKEAEILMESWMLRLAAGKVEAGLKLDVMEAAQAHPALADRVLTFQHTRTSAPRDDLLEGGSLAAGKDLVTNHLGANCLACHTVEEKAGSQVGPLLKGIGALRTRPELLESLVNPVAKIATGFGLVSVFLEDGTNVTGMLVAEDKTNVTLRLADGAQKRIARGDVKMQTSPVSMMPPMLGILTPREVRDVVAYLASLQTKPDKATLAMLELQAAPNPPVKSEEKPAAKPIAKPIAKAAPKPTPKPAPKPTEKVALADVPKALPFKAPEPQPLMEIDSNGQPPSKPEAEPKPKTIAKAKAKAGRKTETKPEPKPEPKPETKVAASVEGATTAEAKPTGEMAANPPDQAAPKPEEKPKASFFSRFRSKPKPIPKAEPVPESTPPPEPKPE